METTAQTTLVKAKNNLQNIKQLLNPLLYNLKTTYNTISIYSLRKNLLKDLLKHTFESKD